MVSTNTRNLSSILELSDLMLAEANHAEIVEKIMDTAADMCDADGGFFYNVNDDKFLTLSYSVNKSLKITRRLRQSGLCSDRFSARNQKPAAEIHCRRLFFQQRRH